MRVSKLILAGIIALAGASASGAVIPLTSGEANGGLTLNPSQVVYAITFGNSAPQTVQGVTFQTSNSNVTVQSFGPFTWTSPPAFATAPGATADDIALGSIVQNLSYYQYSGPATQNGSITNLTPLTDYQVDFLNEITNSGYGGMELFYNGSLTPSDTTPTSGTYDYQDTVESDAAGTLDFSWYNPVGNVFVSGLVVSSVVPEPASLGLLAVSGLALLHRRRLRTR